MPPSAHPIAPFARWIGKPGPGAAGRAGRPPHCRHRLETGATLSQQAVNDALGELARLDPRMVEIIELRFFAGLTEEEVAGTIGVSASTVRREWRLARKWLYNVLHEEDSDDT